MENAVADRLLLPTHYRQVREQDIAGMARIRAAQCGTEDYWRNRISAYLDCRHHPQKALLLRTAYVAVNGDAVVGFVAGHLTRRFECDGELQWINVLPERRGQGVASELFRMLAGWFVKENALKVCVNADPSNPAAVGFYRRHGAKKLNDFWLVWKDIHAVLKE